MTRFLWRWRVMAGVWSELLAVGVLSAPLDWSSKRAVVGVESPAQLRCRLPALFADFSKEPKAPTDLTAWAPVADSTGCSAYPPPVLLGDRPNVVVVRQGSCTFKEKALLAERAGAKGMVLVSGFDNMTVMTGANNSEGLGADFIAVMLERSDGEGILRALNSSELVAVYIALYKPSIVDLSELGIIALATGLVVAGAFFSTADLRPSSPLRPTEDEPQLELTTWHGLGFCTMGSAMLVILFFIMKYLVYVIIFVFCVGGGSSLLQLTSICLGYLVSPLRNQAVNIPLLGPVQRAEVLATIPSLAVVLAFLYYRNTAYGWMFQDVMGAALLCMMQRTLRMPNIQVATFVLVFMFFFDIFWVFLSPLIFKESVMVAVATGGGTNERIPLLFNVPAPNDPWSGGRMLGFGDIVIPGLLVSFLRRYDLMSRKKCFGGYFLPAVLGYVVGLCVTLVVLMLTMSGTMMIPVNCRRNCGRCLQLQRPCPSVLLQWTCVP